jgi:hypothetical protein
MKKILLALCLISFYTNAQSMKIYANGGCVMTIDAATTIKSCDNDFRFQTNEAASTITIYSGNRTFANYAYTQIKKEDGTNLGSSLSDLLVKLGAIKASVINSQTITTTITPVNISYSCLPITSVTIYAASTYKEISISPVNSGTYTLQTGSNTANTGLFNIATLKGENGGLITNITTVTPTGGSTITVCTKQ